MSKWCATGLRLHKEKEREKLKQLHAGGIDGTTCQHLQVMMTHLLQKHWEWQEDRRKDVWHGSERRPTMSVASMDIKTAFRVARPKHIANIMDSPNIHGWIVAALLREMDRVEGKAVSEGVECSFPFTTLEQAKRRKTSVSECDGSATAQAELERAFAGANRAVVGGRLSVEGSPKKPNQRG